MVSANDLKRAWLLKMLGISSSTLSAADLASRVYGGQTVFKLEGTGSPEGTLTAVVGTEYTDKNATNGAIKWIKKSGSGNTGWVVAQGDTGWRNVAGLLVNGWVVTAANGACHVRRVNSLIHWQCSLDGTNADEAAVTILTIPTGFTGVRAFNLNGYWPLPTAATTSDGKSFPIEAHSNGTLRWAVNSFIAPSIVRVAGSYSTEDPWPVALPGVAA